MGRGTTSLFIQHHATFDVRGVGTAILFATYVMSPTEQNPEVMYMNYNYTIIARSKPKTYKCTKNFRTPPSARVNTIIEILATLMPSLSKKCMHAMLTNYTNIETTGP